MNTLLLLLALSAAPSVPQENALAQSFAEAVFSIKSGAVPQHSRVTEAHGGTPLVVEGFAVRCTGYFETEDMAFWGFPSSIYTVTSQGQASAPAYLRYAVVTVSAAAPRVDPPVVPWGSAALPGTCSDILPAPVGAWPVVITTFDDSASQSTVLGWQSACGAGADCLYRPTGMDGQLLPPIACPRGLTMPYGSYSGTVKQKTAVEWAGQDSMPAACR